MLFKNIFMYNIHTFVFILFRKVNNNPIYKTVMSITGSPAQIVQQKVEQLTLFFLLPIFKESVYKSDLRKNCIRLGAKN